MLVITMHTAKRICYLDNSRIATVNMVLWGDTLVTATCWQYSAHGVATGTTEYATRAESLLRRQISTICSNRALFPYNGSCHVNYSAHKLSVP